MSITRALVFLTVVSSISGLAHRYLWVRLVRDPSWPAPVRTAGTVAMVALALAPVISILLSLVLPRAISTPIAITTMVWMGAVLYLLIGVALADLGRTVATRLMGFAFDENRRLLFARGGAGLVGLLTSGVVGAGIRHAYGGPRVKRVRVPLAKLRDAAHGYRIVQLTDVHVGPTIGRDFIARIVDEVNRLSPDLVVITGDLVDGSVDALREHVAPLGRIASRDGVFFVTGNHEYYSGADEWIAHLDTLGIRTLRNERVSIGGEAGFDLAGVDDWRSTEFGNGHGPDLAKALRDRDSTRAVVLLAHQPKQAALAIEHGVDLQLSGHTHAGQLRPFDFLVRLEQPYLAGLYDTGATKVYVSAGTGWWGPPMRVGTTCEITELELVRS